MYVPRRCRRVVVVVVTAVGAALKYDGEYEGLRAVKCSRAPISIMSYVGKQRSLKKKPPRRACL